MAICYCALWVFSALKCTVTCMICSLIPRLCTQKQGSRQTGNEATGYEPLWSLGSSNTESGWKPKPDPPLEGTIYSLNCVSHKVWEGTGVCPRAEVWSETNKCVIFDTLNNYSLW